MRIKLEKRPEPSMLMLVATPMASVLVTMLIGVVVFDCMGIKGFRAVIDIFLTPILASYKWQDVAVKAAPLIIIALGLSIGNRAQVWNIGAEGQYIIGALCAGGRGHCRRRPRRPVRHPRDDPGRDRRRRPSGRRCRPCCGPGSMSTRSCPA